MINVVKEPCTAIFSGQTNCGKTQLVLDLLQHEYKHHFDNIIILCPTLRWNKTYLNCEVLWKDDDVYLLEPKENLFELIGKLSHHFAGEDTLFIIDDIISDENLDKRRQALLELAISGRHRQQSLWLLTQAYTAMPKNLRRQCKMLFTWYPKEKSDVKMIDEESNIVEDWKVILNILKESKHGCLYIRLEHPRMYQIIQ